MEEGSCIDSAQKETSSGSTECDEEGYQVVHQRKRITMNKNPTESVQADARAVENPAEKPAVKLAEKPVVVMDEIAKYAQNKCIVAEGNAEILVLENKKKV